MTIKFCKTCRFYEQFDDQNCMGDCHRYPPTVLCISEHGDCETSVPMVSAKHWCGEWQEPSS